MQNHRRMSLGDTALHLLGLKRDGVSADDSAGDLPAVTEGPAATAPDPEEPADPASITEEKDMPDTDQGAAHAAALEAATVAATKAANDRWMAVLSNDGAKARLGLAVTLLGTSLSAEEVLAAIAADAPAAPTAAAPSLAARMAVEPNPAVTADEGAGEQKPETTADRMRRMTAGKKGN